VFQTALQETLSSSQRATSATKGFGVVAEVMIADEKKLLSVREDAFVEGFFA
jgi:hypothetical protein